MTAINDSLFAPNDAIHANGDRVGFKPAHVTWQREWLEEHPLTGRYAPIAGVRNVWYTDGHAPKLTKAERGNITTIGLLLEPPHLHPENYATAEEALSNGWLDVLFTHQPGYFKTSVWDPSVRPYPLGGTTIHESDWRIPRIEDKLPVVVTVASPKRGLPGHALRHDVVKQFIGTNGFIAVGPDYTDRHERKLPYYGPAMFATAIESVDTGLILSEHLLDCFLTGVMPIYWGPPDALKFWGFDPLGVLTSRHAEGIIGCVQQALDQGVALYESRIEAIHRNFVTAHQYTCPEDWLYRRARELFDD